MKESGPRFEQKNFIEVVGNLALIRKKLRMKPRFAVAFLLSNDFKVYVSPDNFHLKAAKMAELESNNSENILIKGRISPKTSSFIIHETGKGSKDSLRGEIDSNSMDALVLQVVSALKDWLGEGFENYSTNYKGSNFNLKDRSPESIA